MIIPRFRKIVSVEYQDDKNTHSDGGIRQVEDGGEKCEGVSSDQGKPLRPREGEERKFQHIHHPTAEKRGVPTAIRHELSHLARTGIEAVTVKDAVDDIARRTRDDSGDAEHEASFHPLQYHMAKVIAKRPHRNDPQDSQYNLVVPLEEFQTKGDSVILLETDEKPTCHLNALMQVEVRLHVELHDLIDQYDTEDQSGSINQFLFLF